MEITGRIKFIGGVQSITPTFRKRELVITTEEQYPQSILIEFHQDKCEILNQYQLGEPVVVSINLRGREWVNPQGETKYFNSIQGWRIDKVQPQSYAQPNYNQTFPQPNYNQGSAVDAYQNQQNNNPNYGGVQNYQQGTPQEQMFDNYGHVPEQSGNGDDLPF